MKNKLAFYGGHKTITKSFDHFNSFDHGEIKAASKVIKKGVLSSFVGSWSEDFYGGEEVIKFEKKIADYFRVKYAISVNSWTSGLICAVGAIDIEPGDEIILPTWTMSACATAILFWNAIPVFADIVEENQCIDPISIEKNISKKTRAIMAVDICGTSANIKEINKIAKKYKLKVISDTAQAPIAKYQNKFAGTITDIGGISLNYHKHIHTGEGGVIFTNNRKYSEKMKMIRNHAEAVVSKRKNFKLTNMIGFNFRMCEIEASIAQVQLKKLKKIVNKRIEFANMLTQGLRRLRGLTLPNIVTNQEHVFYTYPIIYDPNTFNLSRNKLIKMLNAEGIPQIGKGYVNIHLLPMFQKKIAYGKKGFPWNSKINSRKINYNLGICPVAEDLHFNKFIGFPISMYNFDKEKINLIIKAFNKVWSFLENK